MSFYIRILFSLALAYTLSYGLRTVSAVMAPILKSEFLLNDSQLGLLSATYFITFCVMQLPLGPLLDKYGTRKVEGTLLIIAAIGAIIFAISTSFYGLMIGRLLIGMGVSACLMGAFKTFREHFTLGKQGSLAMFMLFFGTFGALLSSTPTHYLAEITHWRNIFWGIAVFFIIASILIFVNIPSLSKEESSEKLSISLRAYYPILKVPIFWQSAPIFLILVGSFLSIQSLWCLPWFIEVAKLTETQAANALLLMNIAQAIAYLIIGFFIAPWFAKRNKTFELVKIAYVLALSVVLIGLIFPLTFGVWGFILFAFFYAGNTLSYTVLNEHFPTNLVARSSTAGNFLIFIGAFTIQWAMGAYIDMRTTTTFFGNMLSRSDAISSAMFINITAMWIAVIWYIYSGKNLTPKIAKAFSEL